MMEGARVGFTTPPNQHCEPDCDPQTNPSSRPQQASHGAAAPQHPRSLLSELLQAALGAERQRSGESGMHESDATGHRGDWVMAECSSDEDEEDEEEQDDEGDEEDMEGMNESMELFALFDSSSRSTPLPIPPPSK